MLAAEPADKVRTGVSWCAPNVPTATMTTASRPKSPPRDSDMAGGAPSAHHVRAAAWRQMRRVSSCATSVTFCITPTASSLLSDPFRRGPGSVAGRYS